MRLQVPEAHALNAQLSEELYRLRAASDGIKRSNKNGWHSETDLLRQSDPGIRKLKDFLTGAIVRATKEIAPNFDLSQQKLEAEAWANINPQHGYNAPHHHSGFLWSGCYYVAVPQVSGSSSGSIQFLSPLNLDLHYQKIGAACYKNKLTLRPDPGDLLLFPSYLTHWVLPNEAEEDRITIAFNASFWPK